MGIKENILKIQSEIGSCKLIVVTKTKPLEALQELYSIGQKVFGENRVQELTSKYEALPKDIEWHLIGHLQTNKVKYIAPFVSMIHSVESKKLLEEINKQAEKHKRVIKCLLQMYIAKEETKFGLDENEALEILNDPYLKELKNIQIVGVMGMATNITNMDVIRSEFSMLKAFYKKIESIKSTNIDIHEISMGMSSDYLIAVEEGSTMVRVGSAVFANS